MKKRNQISITNGVVRELKTGWNELGECVSNYVVKLGGSYKYVFLAHGSLLKNTVNLWV